MPAAIVPEAGVVRNYNTLLGQDGIVGLKTGSTQAAGGCVVIAAWSQAGAHGTLIAAATFGQPGSAQTILPNALYAGHLLVLALDRAVLSAIAGAKAQQAKAMNEFRHGTWPDQRVPPSRLTLRRNRRPAAGS
jgi:hypothetical protein